MYVILVTVEDNDDAISDQTILSSQPSTIKTPSSRPIRRAAPARRGRGRPREDGGNEENC